MGSPYLLHTQINRIHVVTSMKGFSRIRDLMMRSMGYDPKLYTLDVGSPEWRVIDDLCSALKAAVASRSRAVVCLTAKYEWKGWEKFQRVIVFDFSKLDAAQSEKILSHMAISKTMWMWVDFKYDWDFVPK